MLRHFYLKILLLILIILRSLEGSMEMIRIDVVNKKRVDDPELLENMHDELTTVTKGLAEIKSNKSFISLRHFVHNNHVYILSIVSVLTGGCIAKNPCNYFFISNTSTILIQSNCFNK